MSIFKKPYEISLWDDRLTLVGLDGREYTGAVPDDISIQASYYKEIKICIIGSSEMDTPIRAFEPKLVRNVNGTNTLTFSIYAKYYDEETEEMVDNPFVQYLTNERKLKLKYLSKGEWEWLDFVIKKIDESSNDYVFTYTAEDLFINELSKSGYSLVFDAEIGNNTGTVNELGALILEGTDWQIGEGSELIQQLVEEPLYKIKLATDISAKKIESDESLTIKAGQDIYCFYSQIVNKDSFFFQFIYNEDGQYVVDENRVLTNACVFYLPEGQPVWNGDSPSFAEEMEYTNEYRGEHYVKQQKTVYDPIVGQYVNIYSDGEAEVRGYTEYEYIVPTTTKNLIVNDSGFISTSGWKTKEYEKIELEYDKDNKKSYLKISTDSENAKTLSIHNSGFYSQVSEFAPIKENEQFAFAIKARYGNGSAAEPSVSIVNKSDVTEGDLNFNSSLDDSLKTYFESLGYTYRQGKYEQPQSLKTFEEIRHYIELSFQIKNKDDYILIEDVQLFKIATQEVEGKIYYRLPNGTAVENGQAVEKALTAAVKENKFFYKFDDSITSKDQLIYLDTEKSYTPVYQDNYEKIRSITASESNRFNLLQNLSETFECWCSFDIKHKETGEILLEESQGNGMIISGGTASTTLNDSSLYSAGSSTEVLDKGVLYSGGSSSEKAQSATQYRQQKFVTFHKRIGQKQHAGFRYGINLKGIKRSLDSGDLATKLIVKNNTNEFAENGSCNISLAASNPSGENFILDFSYYIKQGLLNYENFYRELYSENEQRGWIGYFTRLKRLNNSNQGYLIDRETAQLAFQKIDAELQGINGEIEGTKTQLKDQKSDFLEKTKKEYGSADLDASWLQQLDVKGLYEDIGRLELHLAELEKKKKVYDADYTELDEKIKSLTEEIENNKEKRQALNQEFEKKYSRFIQEASWISEDHKDNELYYIDAESTLHKASQPKLSYSIDVIALAALKEYEGYDFDLGDITFVEDTEFFGWVEKDGVKRPYREQIVVTETTTNFDSPEKDSIKVQNYRTQFEDLFQRMAASTQKLEFYSGAYDRAADTVNTDGSIVPEALADAFANNAYILRNSKNQSVVWGDEGLVATNTTNPAEIVRLVSGGLFVTDDGGETWSAGITGKGINAKVITSGELNTEKVSIMSGGKPSFKWDKEGISAYAPDEEHPDVLSSTKYTRFNSDGLVGKNGDFERFKLNWDGLTLKNANGELTLQSDADTGDLTIAGTIQAKDGYIGNWDIKDGGLSYTEEGKTEPSYYLGPEGTTHNGQTYVFKAGEKFGVTPDGEIHATGAKLEEAIVSGEIEAEKGSIGGISISQDGIRSSEAPEASYAGMLQYSINQINGTKTAKIENFGKEEAWYNFHYDVSQLEGYSITATGMAGWNTEYKRPYQVEFYFLESMPTKNTTIPFLARSKTGVTTTADNPHASGTVTWTVPSGAKYLLINQCVEKVDDFSTSVEVHPRGFELTKEGKLNAEAGRIGGFEITDEGIKAKDVSLTERGLSLGKGNILVDGSAHFAEVGLEDDYGNVVGQLKPAQVEYNETQYYGATASIRTNGNEVQVIISVTENLIAAKLFKVYITERSGNKQMIAVSVPAGASSGSAKIPGENISIASYSPTYFNFEQKKSSSVQAVEMIGKFQLTLPENNNDDYTNDILLKQGTSVTSLIKRLLALEGAVAELGINITPETVDL